MKEIIQKVSEERLAICDLCENNSKYRPSIRPDEYCILCGCTLVAKAACLSCHCDVLKWNCVLTPEQEEEINMADE
jgi:hypothetical protein